jgi:hypothetical protein
MVVLFVVGMMVSMVPFPMDEVEGAPNPIPLLTISMLEEVVEIPVHDAYPTIIVIGGQVTIEKGCMERVLLQLEATIDDCWPVTVEPRTMPFINPGSQRFILTIIVPPKSSVDVRTLTVSGFSKAPGTGPITAVVESPLVPLELYASTVEVKGSPCKVGADGYATFSVRIWNLGNVNDTYRLDLTSDSLPILDWDAPSFLTVPYRSSAETAFTVRYEGSEGPSRLMPSELTITSIQTGEKDDPSSTQMWVYDEEPVIGKVFDTEVTLGMMVLILQFGIVIPVLIAYRWWSRGKSDESQ